VENLSERENLNNKNSPQAAGFESGCCGVWASYHWATAALWSISKNLAYG